MYYVSTMNLTPWQCHKSHKLHQAALLLDTCHPAPGGARYMSSVTIEITLHGHSAVSSCHVPRATRVTGEEEGNYRLLNIIWRRQWSVWGPSLPSQQLYFNFTLSTTTLIFYSNCHVR